MCKITAFPRILQLYAVKKTAMIFRPQPRMKLLSSTFSQKMYPLIYSHLKNGKFLYFFLNYFTPNKPSVLMKRIFSEKDKGEMAPSLPFKKGLEVALLPSDS